MTEAQDVPIVPTATLQPVKPGWKTTEFWLSLAAKLLGAAFATGLIGDGGEVARIAGIAAIVLTTLGYQVSRTIVKTAAMLVLLVGLTHTQSACSASSRNKAIQTTLTATNIASSAFVSYDRAKQADIVAHAATKADGQAQLDAWRANQTRALMAFNDAYKAIAAAAIGNDDPSLAAATNAYNVLKSTLQDLGILK